MRNNGIILVTGATGYIGGRLVPRLLRAGYRVRVFVRDAHRLQGRPWVNQVEIFEGDMFKPESLKEAMQDIDIAYYLVHSMMDSNNFHQSDIVAAKNFSLAALEAKVNRIIYLGGLGDPNTDLSTHLRSRQDTGAALRESGVPVTEFRAAVIVGSGSVSFEMIRYLAERLPVMICPQWVYTRIQPIGIRNLLEYIVAAIDTPESANQIIDIGGADVLTYGDMLLQYADVRGLKRLLIPIPVLSPRLSSHWVHWMTPIPKEIAKPLIDGLRNEVVVTNNLAEQLFPDIKPVNYRTAVRLALERLDASFIETTWSDSLSSGNGNSQTVRLTNQEGMIVERRQTKVASPHIDVFNTFMKIGGNRGWLYMNWAWHLRGIIDRMIGGAGFRRGRRHPTQLRTGDALDFWRVETVEPNHLLRLRAEMIVPGQAWLQFDVSPFSDKQSLLVQTAFFAPKGLIGFLYWYILYPIHSLIFSGMIRKLKEQSENNKGFDINNKALN